MSLSEDVGNKNQVRGDKNGNKTILSGIYRPLDTNNALHYHHCNGPRSCLRASVTAKTSNEAEHNLMQFKRIFKYTHTYTK